MTRTLRPSPSPAPHPHRPRRTPALCRTAVAAALLALLLAACADSGGDNGGGTPAPEAPEIAGSYLDEYGTGHTISNSAWVDDFGTYHLVSIDNAADYLVAQNDSSNAWNADKFSRFDWTVRDGVLFFCQIAYDAESAGEAEATNTADRNDLGAGCNGWPWTNLTPPRANRVVAYTPELPDGQTLGSGFYEPSAVLGFPAGSLSVVSLGDDGTGPGGSITVGLGTAMENHCIVDEPGVDFVVYENPFAFTDDTGEVVFTEAAYVEVSEDNVTFHRFAPDFPDPMLTDAELAPLVGQTSEFSNLAGITPGGDLFDLADVIAANAGVLDSTFQACYVRIVDGGTEVPDYDAYGQYGTQDPSGADIDAVEALHWVAAPGLTP